MFIRKAKGHTIYMAENVLQELISAERMIQGRNFKEDGEDIVTQELLKLYNPQENIYGEDGTYISREEKRLLDIWSKIRGIDNIGILDAHGTSKNGRWYFTDRGNKLHSIQDWVNAHQDEHHALLLAVCNPDSHELTSKMSALIYPSTSAYIGWDGKNNSGLSLGGMKVFDLYIPKIGIVNSYTIEKDIKNLERMLKQTTKPGEIR